MVRQGRNLVRTDGDENEVRIRELGRVSGSYSRFSEVTADSRKLRGAICSGCSSGFFVRFVVRPNEIWSGCVRSACKLVRMFVYLVVHCTSVAHAC